MNAKSPFDEMVLLREFIWNYERKEAPAFMLAILIQNFLKKSG
jgi:hypothetical protein